MTITHIITGFLAGIAAGMGLGGGTVLLIYLTLFTSIPQLTAQGINLISFIPTALTAVIIYAVRKKIKWRIVMFMVPFGVIGSLLGSVILPIIPTNFLSKILGGILIFMGLSRLFVRRACKSQE